VSERKVTKTVIPNPPWRMRNLVTLITLNLKISPFGRNDTTLSFRSDTN